MSRIRVKIPAIFVTVAVIFTTVFSASVFSGFATGFTPRLSAPDYSNAYYYSDLNVFYKYGYGMPNCTAYAYGRAYELLGKKPNLSQYDAQGWYDYNISGGYYSYGSTPKLGAIACWSYGSGGHVAVVEKIENGTITLSNSEWGGRTFYLTTASTSDSNPGGNSWWNFQGYIYVLGDNASDTAREPGIYRVVADDYLNMRSGAGTSYPVIVSVPSQTAVNVTEVKSVDGSYWGYTEYSGKRGWICLSYCEYVSELPDGSEAENITVSKTSVTLGAGESYTLGTTVTPSDADATVSFYNSNKNVATVSSEGKITGKASGTTTVTAKTTNGKSASCKATVKNAPTSLGLNKTSLTLGVGESFDLDSKFNSGEASRVVTYTSGNTSTATVNSSGVVTGKAAGSVTITAKTYNGKTAVCKVTVKKAPTSIELNKTSLTLGSGESFDLNATFGSGETSRVVTYSSGNSNIASVDSNGVVTGKLTGAVTVTARTYNGKLAYCSVTIKKAPTSLGLNKTSLTLGSGESYDLDSKLNSGEASRVITYSSSNTAIATVNGSGVVSTKTIGSVTITAKTYNGKTAACKVTVKKAPTSISLNKTDITIGVGETFDFNSSLPTGCASYSVVYSSVNTAVCTVKAAGGLATGKSAGEAIIIAKTYNGKTANCHVTVKNAPTSVSLNATKLTLGVGETFDLNSKIPAGQASRVVTYKSGNTKIAVVDSNGIVTTKATGTVKITASTYNGKTAVCEITVNKAPTKLTLNKTSASLQVGKSLILRATVPSGETSRVITYKSSNTGVATVSATGVVSAKKAGTCTITASTYNGKKATCKITVS